MKKKNKILNISSYHTYNLTVIHYEFHWYEANGLQLEAKLKNKPKERK